MRRTVPPGGFEREDRVVARQNSAPQSTTRAGRAGWSAVSASTLLLLAVAGAALQWLTVVRVGPVPVRLSQLLPFVAAAIFLATRQYSAVTVALRLFKPALVGSVLVVVGVAVSTVVYDSSSIGVVELLELIGNTVLAAVVGAMVVEVIARSSESRLSVHALITVLLVVLALFVPAMVSGQDPFGTLIDAVRAGDGEAVQFALFREALRSGATDADIQSNARHSITAVVLLAAYLTLLSRPRSNRGRQLRILGLVLASVWVVLSISRASWLAAFVPLAVFAIHRAVRAWRTGRTGRGSMILLGVVLLVIVSVSGLVVDRLTTTASYEGRLEGLDQTLVELNSRVFLGGPDFGVVEAPNPHNMILATWLAGGIISALGAVLITAFAARLVLTAASRYLRTGPSSAADLAQAGLATIALARIFTSGGSTVHLSAWLALGAAAGIEYAAYLRGRTAKRTRERSGNGP